MREAITAASPTAPVPKMAMLDPFEATNKFITVPAPVRIPQPSGAIVKAPEEIPWGGIRNARAFLQVRDEFGTFDAYIWPFVKGKQVRGDRKSISDFPASTKHSDAMSKELKSGSPSWEPQSATIHVGG